MKTFQIQTLKFGEVCESLTLFWPWSKFDLKILQSHESYIIAKLMQ